MKHASKRFGLIAAIVLSAAATAGMIAVEQLLQPAYAGKSLLKLLLFGGGQWVGVLCVAAGCQHQGSGKK